MENELIDIREIMIHYLDGSATLEEEIILLNWLRSSDNNRNDFISTRDLWLSCDAVADNKLEVDIALKKFRRRISAEVKKEEPQAKPAVTREKLPINKEAAEKDAKVHLSVLPRTGCRGNLQGCNFPRILQQIHYSYRRFFLS